MAVALASAPGEADRRLAALAALAAAFR